MTYYEIKQGEWRNYEDKRTIKIIPAQLYGNYDVIDQVDGYPASEVFEGSGFRTENDAHEFAVDYIKNELKEDVVSHKTLSKQRKYSTMQGALNKISKSVEVSAYSRTRGHRKDKPRVKKSMQYGLYDTYGFIITAFKTEKEAMKELKKAGKKAGFFIKKVEIEERI